MLHTFLMYLRFIGPPLYVIGAIIRSRRIGARAAAQHHNQDEEITES